MHAKEAENDVLIKENERNKNSLKQCSFELEQVKEAHESLTSQSKRELGEMRNESDDLLDLVKTKERMLEDQVQQINQLKKEIADREDELAGKDDAKQKYRDFYEDKLALEIEATERAKQKLEDAQLRLQEVEDENENMRQDL